MKCLLHISLIALLASCATEAGYKETLDFYLETPESFLIEGWGAPDNVYEADGYKYLTYYKNSSVYMPASYNTTFYGHSAHTMGYGGGAVQMNCKTTFKVKDSEVISYSYEGNGCRM